VVQQVNAYNLYTKRKGLTLKISARGIHSTNNTKGLHSPSKVPIIFGYQEMTYHTPQLLRKKSHDYSRLQRSIIFICVILIDSRFRFSNLTFSEKKEKKRGLKKIQNILLSGTWLLRDDLLHESTVQKKSYDYRLQRHYNLHVRNSD